MIDLDAIAAALGREADILDTVLAPPSTEDAADIVGIRGDICRSVGRLQGIAIVLRAHSDDDYVTDGDEQSGDVPIPAE